jgi:hypothetical protein
MSRDKGHAMTTLNHISQLIWNITMGKYFWIEIGKQEKTDQGKQEIQQNSVR